MNLGLSRNWLSLFLLAPVLAVASPDLPSRSVERGGDLSKSRARSINAREAFARTQAVLQHFGVPDEPDSQPLLDDLNGLQTTAGIAERIPFLDLSGGFQNFSFWDAAWNVLSVFRDRASKQVSDFKIRLAENAQFTDLKARLLDASMNPEDRPLAGLRIALDPGHMGGPVWDRRTEKYIEGPDGKIISEGLINLQTALLLESELVKLGATVFLTRRTLAPVTSIEYETFPLRDYALQEFRKRSLEDWFVDLLTIAPPGPKLYNAFAAHHQVKAIFSESMRSQYFILNADLTARKDLIRNFAPDITLVIHFDTMARDFATNGTKAYVPGAFTPAEFATREDRRYFARHLLNPTAWDASIQLSQSVVNEISRKLDIPFDRFGGSPNVKRVAPGVFARNLNLSRRITDSATCYAECFFYNDPAEFRALTKTTHPLIIDGQNHPYSDRLLQVVGALKTGIVSFVRSFR